ncbi:hypothetical protein CUC51_10750 [Citrobacter freundii]|nr:hypothetical protein CUC51_10750 [Citrobacter freundii]EBI9493426.1 hypothetical protein [Salmonella enterica]
MVLPSLRRLPPPNFLHTQQRRAPAFVGDCNRHPLARVDWVMSPSPGDALFCCVKRAVPR